MKEEKSVPGNHRGSSVSAVVQHNRAGVAFQSETGTQEQRFIPEEFGGKTVARRIVIDVGHSLLMVPLVRHVERRCGERLVG